MNCSKCGSKNPNDARICQNCGASISGKHDTDITMAMSPVEIEQEQKKKEIEITETTCPVLIVNKGPYVGQRFSLDKNEITLGRDPGSDIFLDDVTVSRNHARIIVQADQVRITDVGSLNGTFVNQERIDSETILHSNDELHVGKFQLIYLACK